MAWNEPENNDRDPWGKRRNEQGPPDLDEVLRRLQDRLRSLLGGRGSHGSRPATGPVLDGARPIGLLLLALLCGWLIYDTFYRVEPAERGVVRRFGAYVTTLQPGPHFRFPRPIEFVTKVNVEQFRVFSVDATMLTGDENIVDVQVATQYRIKDSTKFMFNISDPDETVRQLTESSIREIIGTSTIDLVMTERRGEVTVLARDLLQQILDGYDAGIEVTSVNLQEVKAPEQVKASFDDAIKAREDEQRKINEAQAYRNEMVERSQGEADRMRREAEAYREQVVANATGESSRFEQVLTEYTKAPEITRTRLYLDAMESVLSGSSKVMLDAKDSNSLMYLPLDRLINQPSTARPPPVLDPANSVASPPVTGTATRGGYDTRQRELR